MGPKRVHYYGHEVVDMDIRVDMAIRKALLVVAFFPVLAFAVAGFIELRSGKRSTEKLRNLIPIILGIAAFGFGVDPQEVLGAAWTPTSSATLAHLLAMFSVVIACSGLFMSYSRRASAISVAAGGLVLALFWWFNRILV